ncbi:kelch repeat-containing protein [Candidatus Nitronereus thalassa]|uniref:Kelch repeat-containing protein n=1 Tax=Candidatus Nitronereus thalassa TaxID=3020898 RepID=A0ABU3K473_9BACT|nr:kelch repeat-containing protein [Candidatus Nitronereus thalassa]MDT7041192.1 kelch repeat-containing protein [Candidatus Nitronereus thalassa]
MRQPKIFLFASVWTLCSFFLVGSSHVWGTLTEPHFPEGTTGLIKTPLVSAKSSLTSRWGKLPLSFEENLGQADARFKFLSRGQGYTLLLSETDAFLALPVPSGKDRQKDSSSLMDPTADSLAAKTDESSTVVQMLRMSFVGADTPQSITGSEQLPGIVNYFLGDDPRQWRTGIPTYQKVAYADLYPGIDVVYYGRDGQLEYDLVVAPGADPSLIQLAFEGAEQIEVDGDGHIRLALPSGTLFLKQPVVYQYDDDGLKHRIAGHYVLEPGTSVVRQHVPAGAEEPGRRSREASAQNPHVRIVLAEYDQSRPVIIDPILFFSTYLGGSGDEDVSTGDAGGVTTYETGAFLSVGPDGAMYVTGGTFSVDFTDTCLTPDCSIFDSTLDGTQDVFVSKITADGKALVFSTYLGGSGTDRGRRLAVDGAGTVYVTGITDTPGSGFPGTAGSLIQSTYGGGSQDAFVLQLTDNGTSIGYATYLGGIERDAGLGIAVDGAGYAYVSGSTSSQGSGFPGTSGSLIQAVNGGGSDGFVAKVMPGGSGLAFSTYLGGTGSDQAFDIALDTAGNAYVTGLTDSPNSEFPGTVNSAIQSTNAGTFDAFIIKLKGDGSDIDFSTYLGTTGSDQASAITVDAMGNSVVTGLTNATASDFPGASSSLIQPTYGGGQIDGFVTKIAADGSAILFSTYLGGNGVDRGEDIAVDRAGDIHVTGFTSTPASGFPGTAASTIQSINGGGTDAFVTVMKGDGSALGISTYLGSSGTDAGFSVDVDLNGNPHVAGLTDTPASGFPGTLNSPLQSTNNGGIDAFVAKVCRDLPVPADPGTWSQSLNLSSPRASHTATLLPDGRVLIAGGQPAPGQSGFLSSAELYDPVTNSWTPTGSMHVSRNFHTATLLPNGKVMITGGQTINAEADLEVLTSTELYDVATGQWTELTGPNQSMSVARFAHTATLLPNGQVLVAGGHNTDTTTEVFDPRTNTWTTRGNLLTPRVFATATLLTNGNVLLAGGRNTLPSPDREVFRSAELFDYTVDPAVENPWSLTGDMQVPHSARQAVRLADGRVLVAGSQITDGAPSEIYDPNTGTWILTDDLNISRRGFGMVRLADGRVFAAGGSSTNAFAGELYTPTSGLWTEMPPMSTQREFPTATVLGTGQVLVVGGFTSFDGVNTVMLNTAELFTPNICGPEADLSADLSVLPDPIIQGTSAEYFIQLANNGPDDASQVEVILTLPEGTSFDSASGAVCTATSETVTCDVGTVVSGGTPLVRIFLVTSNMLPGNSVASVEVRTVGEFDPNYKNNVQQITTLLEVGDIPPPPPTLEILPADLPSASSNVLGRLGHAVSHAGDFNNDGVPDLIVGAPGSNSDAGTAHLLVGPSGTEAGVLAGSSGEQLGTSVAYAGDFNHDGIDDVIIGAPFSAGTGKAYIAYGGQADFEADVILQGEIVGSAFGTSVYTAGDFNNDGIDDVVVGAPEEKKVYLFFGHDTGSSPVTLLASQADWTIGPNSLVLGSSGNPQFGVVVRSGDFGNSVIPNDGISDVIIGSPFPFSPLANNENGRMAVVLGGQDDAVIDWVTQGDDSSILASDSDRCGVSVALWNPAVTGNAVLGCPGITTDSPGGTIQTQGGAGTGFTIRSRAETGEQFGWDVANAGDFNGDGASDLIVGSPFLNNTFDPGKATLIVDQNDPNQDLVFEGTEPDSQFGYAVSSAGDLNNDGLIDVIVGAPNANSASGQIFVFYGQDITVQTSNPQVDLALTAIDSPDPAFIGQSLVYVLEVSNPGPDVALDTLLTATVPSSMTVNSATFPGGFCSGSSGVTCELGTLSVNTSTQIILDVTPSELGQTTFTAAVTNSVPELDTANNSVVELTDVVFPVPPSQTSFDVTVSPSSLFATTPVLGEDSAGRYVVFTQVERISTGFGPGDIFLQRINDNGVIGLPVAVASDDVLSEQLNDAEGDFVVYTAFESDASTLGQIRLYQISTGNITVLRNSALVREARIHGDSIAWVEGPVGASTIQLLDFSGSSGPARITLSGPHAATSVEIGQRLVVWEEFDSSTNPNQGQHNIKAYDLTTGQIIDIANDANLSERYPHTSGAWIVWESSDFPPEGTSKTWSIELLNVDTSERRTAVQLEGFVTYAPTIDGDLVTWESNVTGNFEIFVYRISTGEIFQVTNLPDDQRLNDVFGNQVAFIANAGSQVDRMDISVITMSFAPPVSQSDIQVVPTVIDFGDVELATSQSATVTISNVGPTSNLTLESVSLESGGTGDLALTLTPTTPFLLTPGASTDVEVRFTPSSESSHGDVLEIASDDVDEPLVSINLTGRGVVPVVPPSSNIDPDEAGEQFAYGENIGWINFQPIFGPGVAVTDTTVEGFAYAENIGWINLHPSNGSGVMNDGTGHLHGYAWAENVGWISMSCRNTDSCATANYHVIIDPVTGELSGRAWGENIGWITFRSVGPVAYGVTTGWRPSGPLPSSIHIDATALTSPTFEVSTKTGSFGTSLVNRVNLIPDQDYTLVISDAAAASLNFRVDVNGLVDFDPALDGFVSGRGTDTLVVSGFPLEIDIRQSGAASFTVFGGTNGEVAAEIQHSLQLIPGIYTYQPDVGTDFNFEVVLEGTVDFDPLLDGFVSGRGTSVLLINADPFSAGLFTVNATDDSNDGVCNLTHCSLREAIIAANARADQDLIAFDLDGEGPHTIQPTAALPSLTDPVIIDGTTQAGYADVPVIELDGSNAGVSSSGLTLSTSDSTVRGLVINRFDQSGILIGAVGGNNKIEGNYIGTTVTGGTSAGNGLHGVLVNNSPNNSIGSTATGLGNVLSGNGGAGVRLIQAGATGNMVRGNYIGTNALGTSAVPNQSGVVLTLGANQNLIGGTATGEQNVISGNTAEGVLITLAGSDANRIVGNYIGTAAQGKVALSNGTYGLFISNAANNVVGGVLNGERNVISGNTLDGILLTGSENKGTQIVGNFIGTDIDGLTAVANGNDGIELRNVAETIVGGPSANERNLISGNGQDGIRIEGTVATNNTVLGNFIGTDVTGNRSLGNTGSGIRVNNGSGNTIGSFVRNGGNVISGNIQHGVELNGVASVNALLGNLIGTNATGTSAVPNGQNGVRIFKAQQNVIGGTGPNDGNLISGNGASGIEISQVEATGNIIQGNYIGTDVTGTVALGNTVFGMNLALASNNIIGGNTPAARNVISGNSTGIRFSGAVNTGNVVQGNFIGTDKDGTGALGNTGDGIVFVGSANGNLIGGTIPGAGNVISGNGDRGIEFQASAGPNNRVEGNLIGTDFTGTSAIGNTSNGILVQANGMIIGGTTEGAGNVISGNASGITITKGASMNLVMGNYIGTTISGNSAVPNAAGGVILLDGASENMIGPDNLIAFNGTDGVALTANAGVGNTITQNRMHSNGDLGIDVGFDGVTLNDDDDVDVGPNQRQNFPVLSFSSGGQGQATVRGTLSSFPLTTYTIEFFGTESCDPAGLGEGGIFLGSQVIETNGQGEAKFVAQVSGADPSGIAMTATATAPDGSTSEFSACLQDSDNDGLADGVDLEPNDKSKTFSDGPVLGGSTFGEVLTEGNQQLMISADPGPTGIRLFTDPSGGGQEARVSVCMPNNLDESVLRLERDTEVTVRCGSVDLEVFTGNVTADIQLTGDSATLTVTQGSRAVVDPETGTITAPSTNIAPVMVAFEVNGEPATVELGAGNELTADPSEGTFTTPSTNPSPVVVVVGGKPVTVVAGENAKFVEIDIKPGSEDNPINLGSNGKIPVAILSSATFDATTVDSLTVTLADAQVRVKGNGTAQASEEDVNGDGRTDLVVHIETEGLQLTGEATSATLEGQTTTGQRIKGTDVVTVVP